MNTVIANGKRFMAYEIIALLEKKGEETILKRLQAEVKSKDRIVARNTKYGKAVLM